MESSRVRLHLPGRLPKDRPASARLVCYTQDRVGGRVATFRKGNYVADLGAMVVTGLGKTAASAP